MSAQPATWWLLAECRGLTVAERDDIFFPSPGKPTRFAKAICNVCPVRDECLNYAMTHHEHYGIWGGLSEQERRRLRRARAFTLVARFAEAT